MPAGFKGAFVYEAAAVVAGALLLARIGPFGTSAELGLGARHAYWIGTVFFAWSQVALARSLFARASWTAERPISRAIASALGGAVPTVFVVAWVETLLRAKGPFTPTGLLELYGNVATVSLALTAVAELARTRSATPRPRITATSHPRIADESVVANVDLQRFFERLPRRIGREVYAVEAEDHYLRVHTRLGSDLILLSMARAMDELVGVDGMRVHRSWWVARDAVAGWERDGDRLTLVLKNGGKVPVSRTYALLVRNAGWLSEAA